MSASPGPWWVARQRPVAMAVALALAAASVTVVSGTVAGRVLPGGGDAEMTSRLVAVLVVAAAALLVVGRAGAWRRTGAAGASTWRSVRLLAVPAGVALAPALTGFDLPAVGTLTVLVVGYAATGIFEELWHRGVILDTLRPVGLRRAAVIGGALFAATHLANIAFGQPVAVSLAQSVGAFCFGVGFSVFRWRTDAVWLLAGIHSVGDLMFKITDLHGGALWGFLVGHDIAMLLWGLWCLRALGHRSPAQTRCGERRSRGGALRTGGGEFGFRESHRAVLRELRASPVGGQSLSQPTAAEAPPALPSRPGRSRLLAAYRR